MIEKTVTTAADYTNANRVGPDPSGKQLDILISDVCIARIFKGPNSQQDVVGDITLTQSVSFAGATGCFVKDFTAGTHATVIMRLWQIHDPTPTFLPAGAISVSNAVLPAGSILAYGGATAPAGYVLCDGSTYDGTTATYAALWAAIGIAYGGTGQSAFQVPDFRGRMIAGLGTHADVNSLADNDGVALANRTPAHNSTNSLTLPNHVHSVTDPGHSHTFPVAGGAGSSDRTNSTGVFTSTAGIVGTASTGVAVGNPTTNPAISGTVGPGGTLPVDRPAYGVASHIISLGAAA